MSGKGKKTIAIENPALPHDGNSGGSKNASANQNSPALTNIEAENPASLVILNKQTKSPSKTNKKSKKESQKNLMDSIKGKINKHGKNKLMYANFSIPDEDRHKISLLKETLLSLGIKAKKNEILRAGLYALETLTQQNLKKIFGKMEQTKIRKAK